MLGKDALGAQIEQVARHFYGEPNRRLSKGGDLRFGRHGSLSVITAGPKAGTWYDHENQTGGGVRELLARNGVDDPREWLGLEDRPQDRPGKQRIVATYDYRGEAGELLYQAIRYGPHKSFSQQQPGPGKGGILRDKDGRPTMQGARLVPYRLPQLLEARRSRNGHAPRVYVTEGEKDADRLAAWGLIATTNVGGAEKWRDEYSPHLAGCEVIILEDNDAAGRRHAAQVARSVQPHAESVKRILLDGLEEKGDVSDWIDDGGTQSVFEDIVDAAECLGDPPPAPDDGTPTPFHLLTLGHWLDRDLPDPDFMLGEVLSTTTRAMLVGPTGLGKTMLGLALAMALAAGQDFLHWRVLKPWRVLYLDGEMSRRLMKRRVADEMSRVGCDRDVPLFVLSREDFPDMAPLNSEAGQQFVDRVIDELGGVDLIIPDNIQAWTVGDQREETTWEPCLPWSRDLTRRGIGQLWMHHTGLDQSHSYGPSAREWGLDTVMLMETVERPDADLAFRLKFTKARERTPDNRADFEPAIITLTGDEWASETGGFSASRPGKRTLDDYALDQLIEALAAAGESVADPKIPITAQCVDLDLWRRYFCQNYVGAADPESIRKMFYRFAAKLQVERKIRVEKPWVWRL